MSPELVSAKVNTFELPFIEDARPDPLRVSWPSPSPLSSHGPAQRVLAARVLALADPAREFGQVARCGGAPSTGLCAAPSQAVACIAHTAKPRCLSACLVVGRDVHGFRCI